MPRSLASPSRRRFLAYLVAAVSCFLLVLGVSRLVDVGLVEGDGFGAGDWRRSTTGLEVHRWPVGGGERRALGGESAVDVGDELEFSYRETRYLYLWVFRIDRTRRLEVVIPENDTGVTEHGHRVQPAGEVIPRRYRVRPDDDGAVLVGFLTGLPYRGDALRAAREAIDAEAPEAVAKLLPLSGQRFLRTLSLVGPPGPR